MQLANIAKNLDSSVLLGCKRDWYITCYKTSQVFCRKHSKVLLIPNSFSPEITKTTGGPCFLKTLVEPLRWCGILFITLSWVSQGQGGESHKDIRRTARQRGR